MYYLYKNFFHDQRIFNYFNFKIFHSYVSLNMLKKNQSNCLLKFCQGMPSILSSTLTLGQSGLKLIELSFGNILIKKLRNFIFHHINNSLSLRTFITTVSLEEYQLFMYLKCFFRWFVVKMYAILQTS